MKKIINSIERLIRKGFTITCFILLIAVSACNQQKGPVDGHEHSAATATTYTCPMHPQIVEEEPGACPICGMDLVPQSVEGGEVEVTDALNTMLNPTNYSIISDIRTIHPVLEQKVVVSSFPGVVTYDTRQTYSLPIRVGGRIEELYVRYNFQPVKKGQKLLEIYSPELLTVQREFLFLLESDPDNEGLIEAAKKKLRLLGVSESQISQLISNREEQYSFPVYSPYSGYIVEVQPAAEGRNASASTGLPATGMSGMSAGGGSVAPRASVPGVPAELSIQEGMYVQPGQGLFKIIDASQLWAVFNVSAEEASIIEEGDPLEISWGPGELQQLHAKVNLIQPFFSAGENFSTIRAYLKNTALQVGQLVEGQVKTKTPPALWVPSLAVLDLGNRELVFVKQEGVLRPKEVIIGIHAGEMTEIKEGLTAEDAIAHNAQFLIDSEDLVKTGDLKLEN